MLTSDREIRHRIERLVARTGGLDCAGLLVALDRLTPAALREWEQGERDRLTDALFGDPRAIAEELTTGLAVLRDLGLVPSEIHAGRRGGSLPGLPDDWANRRYRRQALQRDLFLDGGAQVPAHELTLALLARDPARGEAKLALLEGTDPDHPLTTSAPILLAGLRRAFRGDDEDWRTAEQLATAAEAALGKRAAAFMEPVWRDLAEAAQAREDSIQHASAAWMRIPDWAAVRDSLGPDPRAIASPELLARGVRARRHGGDYRGAVAWFFELCWRFPETGEAIEDLADTVLGLDQALDAWADRDLGGALGWRRFPEWLLLRRYVPPHPSLAATSSPPSLGAVVAIVAQPQRIDLRRQLQATAPELVAEFLAGASAR